jgi:choline dehydrogenase-like flavoprotein
MRHLLDYHVIKPKKSPQEGDLIKQLAWNDFYITDGIKLGTVQSNGSLPPASIVSKSLRDDIAHHSPLLGHIVSRFLPLIEIAIKASLKKSIVFVSIMEDFPHPKNRVTLGEDGNISIEYSIHEQDRKRLQLFREKIKNTLIKYSPKLNKAAQKNSILGHACGTCRFGDSPQNSVLDRHNKAHELDNLYIVDSSFFPTSGGTNPSLTIAANALRVADHINRLKINFSLG